MISLRSSPILALWLATATASFLVGCTTAEAQEIEAFPSQGTETSFSIVSTLLDIFGTEHCSVLHDDETKMLFQCHYESGDYTATAYLLYTNEVTQLTVVDSDHKGREEWTFPSKDTIQPGANIDNTYHNSRDNVLIDSACLGDMTYLADVRDRITTPSPSNSPSESPSSSVPSAFPSDSPTTSCILDGREFMIYVFEELFGRSNCDEEFLGDGYFLNCEITFDDGYSVLAHYDYIPGDGFAEINEFGVSNPRGEVYGYRNLCVYDYFDSLPGGTEFLIEEIDRRFGLIARRTDSPSDSPSASPTIAAINPTASPTTNPTATPTASPTFCSAVESSLFVKVVTDDKNSENSWVLEKKNLSTGAWEVEGLSDLPRPNFSHEDTFCLEPGRDYQWILSDSAGDGMDTSQGGSFLLELNEVAIFVSGRSQAFRAISKDFTTPGDPYQTDSPTASPTSSPTINPTASPTPSPTASPTASPTDIPTANPTASPTVSPTTDPTTSPTDIPTASPTASPTVSPTTDPTNAPTEICINHSGSHDFDPKEGKTKSKECSWLEQKIETKGEKKGEELCKKPLTSGEGQLFDKCPVTCAAVGLGPCAE